MSNSSTPRRHNKKKALLASATLLAVALGGTIATGAWFTDERTVTQNKLDAGTVQLGAIGETSDTALEFKNVLPVADVTDAKYFNVNVRNTGTADINWTAAFKQSGTWTATQNAFANQLRVQYSTDDGTTWSSESSLSDVSSTPIASSAALESGSNAQIMFRAWLPSTAGNEFQANSLAFDVTVRAIQSDAPADEISNDSNFTPLYRPLP